MTFWDCVNNNTESSGLSQKDAQSGDKWRRNKGQPAKPGSPGKTDFNTVCVCGSFCVLQKRFSDNWQSSSPLPRKRLRTHRVSREDVDEDDTVDNNVTVAELHKALGFKQIAIF